MVRPPEPSTNTLDNCLGCLYWIVVRWRLSLLVAHDAQVLMKEEVPVQRTAASLCVKLHWLPWAVVVRNALV